MLVTQSVLLFSSQVRLRWVSTYPNDKFKAPKTHISCAYSQADLAKFPTRKGFGKCIKKHFNSGSGKFKLKVLDMCQTETPKWRGTLSCCFEVYWSKMLTICARKHIFEGGSGGHFLRQLRQLLFCTLIHMQRWWFCSPKQAPPQFRWSCITPDKIVNPSLPTS